MRSVIGVTLVAIGGWATAAPAHAQVRKRHFATFPRGPMITATSEGCVQPGDGCVLVAFDAAPRGIVLVSYWPSDARDWAKDLLQLLSESDRPAAGEELEYSTGERFSDDGGAAIVTARRHVSRTADRIDLLALDKDGSIARVSATPTQIRALARALRDAAAAVEAYRRAANPLAAQAVEKPGPPVDTTKGRYVTGPDWGGRFYRWDCYRARFIAESVRVYYPSQEAAESAGLVSDTEGCEVPAGPARKARRVTRSNH